MTPKHERPADGVTLDCSPDGRGWSVITATRGDRPLVVERLRLADSASRSKLAKRLAAGPSLLTPVTPSENPKWVLRALWA